MALIAADIAKPHRPQKTKKKQKPGISEIISYT